MMVSKTLSIELNDLAEIQKKVRDGESSTFSEFVQRAIKNELKR